jgi:hypothetical protein
MTTQKISLRAKAQPIRIMFFLKLNQKPSSPLTGLAASTAYLAAAACEGVWPDNNSLDHSVISGSSPILNSFSASLLKKQAPIATISPKIP